MEQIVVRADEHIERLLPLIQPFLERALEHASGEMTVQDVALGIATGRCQLWLVGQDRQVDAVAVTELVAYPRLKSVRVMLLSGQGMNGWARHLDTELKRFALSEGASRLEAVGRKGFIKTLAPLNFKPQYTVYVKELEDE